MKLLDRGVVWCFVVLFCLVWECRSDNTRADLSIDEEKKKEDVDQNQDQNQDQTQALTGGGGGGEEEHLEMNKNPPDQQNDSGRINGTETPGNETLHSVTPTAKATTSTPPTVKPILPVQTGVKAQEEEQSSGMSIFFSLLVIGICIVLVHLLIKFKLHFLPESVAVVSLGILMGAVIKIIETQELANWKITAQRLDFFTPRCRATPLRGTAELQSHAPPGNRRAAEPRPSGEPQI